MSSPIKFFEQHFFPVETEISADVGNKRSHQEMEKDAELDCDSELETLEQKTNEIAKSRVKKPKEATLIDFCEGHNQNGEPCTNTQFSSFQATKNPVGDGKICAECVARYLKESNARVNAYLKKYPAFRRDRTKLIQKYKIEIAGEWKGKEQANKEIQEAILDAKEQLMTVTYRFSNKLILPLFPK